jgi:PAS domain S-box-containing protein
MTLQSLLLKDDIPEDVKGEIKLAIADQRKTEEDLIKTKTRFHHLLKSSPAVIYSCEPWGEFQTAFMSENVQEITGYEVHEFLHNPTFWINGIHPDDRQRAVNNFEDIVQKERYSETYRFQNKDGSYQWMLDEATLIKDEKGSLTEIVG